MLTKADFQQAIRDSIDAYPAVAPLYQAGDPRITQHLDAMATMLAMFSAQIETAQAEPFEKVRDATVLADAAMRGIVRKGVASRAQIRLKNEGTATVTIASGRAVIDSSGRPYIVDTAATVAAGAEGTFVATQARRVRVTHTVSEGMPFYAIPVPSSDSGEYLCSIAVSDASGEYQYRDRYVNIGVGDRVYHVEADDRQQVYVRFGFGGIVGVQPVAGDVLFIDCMFSYGDVSPSFGSPFSLDYLANPNEAALKFSMDAQVEPGQAPIPMAVLRDLARYPSVYDNNAVFLGEFDYLVRRNFPALQFLSVWNETSEERARGADFDNINALFVACLSASGVEQMLDEPDALVPVPPVELEESDLTATQKAIRDTIKGADDSYRIRFFTPVRSKVKMTINARISTSYVVADVIAQIRESLLGAFGKESASSRRGMNRPLYRRVYALLRQKVPALSVGESDLTVTIDEPTGLAARPEMWRYLADDSLTVNISTVNAVTPSWGG